MNCQAYQSKIDQEPISADVSQHIDLCNGCRAFRQERARLQEFVGNLERVAAPANFEFGLRAKMQKANKANGKSFWQRKFIYAAPTFAGLLILTFAFLGNLTTPTQNNEPQVAGTSALPVTQPEIFARETSSLQSAHDDAVVAASPKITSAPVPAFAAAQQSVTTNRRNVLASRTPKESKRSSVSVLNASDEPVNKSRDSGVGQPEEYIVPPGIPHPLSSQPEKVSQPNQQKLQIQDLLKFVGIDTSEDSDGLRVTVVKSDGLGNKAGVKSGDVIESVNGKKPVIFSDNTLNDLTLKVRREFQTQEIKIAAKP